MSTDASGNRTEKNEGGITTTYTYDAENRLIRITKGTDTITYTYDPFGRRIAKTVNGTMTRYVYDQNAIVAEYNNLGNVTARYAHSLNIDEPLAMQQDTTTSFYHADGLGSIVALTNTSGIIVQTYSYDSFGNITQTGSITQLFTYTAREYDNESGLYFYRARYYDPKTGRFVSRDPISFAGGDVNLYGYVGNNPINWIDPSGLYDSLFGQRSNPFTYWRDFFGGAGDLYRNYKDMRDANTIGADKYFHCMGHCEASRRGDGGKDASELIGEGREQFDEKIKGDSRKDCDADRAANNQGRNGKPNTPCNQVCGSLRPNGLNQRY